MPPAPGDNIYRILTHARHWTRISANITQWQPDEVSAAMDGIVSPSKFICWSPNNQYDGIWGRYLWEVIRVRWGHEGGGLIVGLDSTELAHYISHRHTEKWPCEDRMRKWLSTSKEEGSHQNPTMLTPWSLTSSLWNCEKMSVVQAIQSLVF